MDKSPLARLLVLFFLVVFEGQVEAVIVKYYCLPSTTAGSEFQFNVRLNTEGNAAITGITAVTQVVALPVDVSSCKTTSTESTNIFLLSKDVDVDAALPCGMTSSGTVYTMWIKSVGPNEYYSFTCDTSDLLPSSVDVTGFNTHGMTNVMRHRENPSDVKFQVFHADTSNAPARTVDLGENIMLRMIYDPAHHTLEATNWGMVFHTGFIAHEDGSTIRLHILTEGLGTSVHITGRLATKLIDEWVTVKRDHVMAFDIPYEEYHQSTVTKEAWVTEKMGLRIESIHDKIGVVVKGHRSSEDADRYVVLPDDILHTKYTPMESAVTPKNMRRKIRVVVIATEDSTQVNITYNGYTRPAGFTINGVAVNPGDALTTVTLDEYEVLNVACNKRCSRLKIESSAKIAMVAGWKNQGHAENKNDRGASSTQVIPDIYYGREYVFVEPFFNHGTYLFNTDDTGGPTISYSNNVAMDVTVNAVDYLEPTAVTEVSFSEPVTIYKHTSETGGTPSLVQFPSVAQWAIRYSVPVEEGTTYAFQIVSTTGDIAGIKVRVGDVTTLFSGPTIGDAIPTFGAISPVDRLFDEGAQATRYEYIALSGCFDIIDSNPLMEEKGVIELTSSNPSKPFMLIVYQEVDDEMSIHLPIGARYSPQNPCTVTQGRSGDNIDNDCDGRVDEETANGADDGDSDVLVDEDTTLHSTTAGFRGIYVSQLIVSDTDTFTTSTTIIQNGCNIITPNTREMAQVGTFVKNTVLNSAFDRLWVIDTSVFNAFRYVGKDVVYFRVTYGFCVANVTLCENSCPSKRKRSVDEVVGGHTIDLKLEVKGNETEIHVIDTRLDHHQDVYPLNEVQCLTSYVFMVPSAMLLTIILFEVFVSLAFMYIRSKYI